MENRQEIQQELQELSPELATILPVKIEPLPSQADYFDKLPQQLIGKVSGRKNRRIFSLSLRIAAAACLVGTLYLTVLLRENNSASDFFATPELSITLATVSNEEIQQFLNQEDPLHDEGLAPHLQQLSTDELKEISRDYINDVEQ